MNAYSMIGQGKQKASCFPRATLLFHLDLKGTAKSYIVRLEYSNVKTQILRNLSLTFLYPTPHMIKKYIEFIVPIQFIPTN